MEFNTGRINLNRDHLNKKDSWFCDLCQDIHYETKEKYEEVFEREQTFINELAKEIKTNELL